ncbi:hypothetical protein Voc01_025310 [Virgisporangium ochraceum]|uniref:Uncharacterized protein n=1 Tax=Virgisporangium ochraceum TaxID=65505 RepID=A0A8J4EAJ9_9ACTN|nr:hypothetical protein Voc01_025310 [Virgisporangium ochraceum]
MTFKWVEGYCHRTVTLVRSGAMWTRTVAVPTRTGVPTVTGAPAVTGAVAAAVATAVPTASPDRPGTAGTLTARGVSATAPSTVLNPFGHRLEWRVQHDVGSG